MADVTITTDTVELFSHEMYFVLTLDDASTASYDARLLDIGKLKYYFDVPNDGEETTAIGVKAGAMDITLENYFIDSADEFIDTLVSSYDFSNPTWEGKMYHKLKGGSFGEPVLFTFTQSDVEFDQNEQTVSISLNPKEDVDLGITDFGDSISGQVSVYMIQDINSAVEFKSILAKEWIQHWLYQTFTENPTYPMSQTPVVSSGIFTTTGNPTSGTQWFAWYDSEVGGNPAADLDNPAITPINKFAALEGALYGGSLGVPFYVARSNTDNTITLDSDNIEVLDQIYFTNAKYRNLIMTQTGVDSNGDEGSVFEEVASNNEFAEKNMNISITESLIVHGNITSGSAGDRLAVNNSILQKGIVNYPLAFSFQANKKATVTYWGIDGIYPYSVINFDVDAPSVFQNRDFRISEIVYDFKQDKAEMEIYEI